MRAREDSTKVLLRLARSPHVGGAAVGLHALRPLPNSKSQHAALGRLELLAGVVSGCGLEEYNGTYVADGVTGNW